MSAVSVEDGQRGWYRGGSRTLAAQRKKKAAFLEAYVRCGVLSEAARAAGVERTTHYWWLRHDPEYAEAFAEAERQAGDLLVEEARRRAFKGSDLLLIFLIKGIFPERYRDNYRVEHAGQVEHSGKLELGPALAKAAQAMVKMAAAAGVEPSVADAEQRIRKIMTGASQITIDAPARILP